MEKEKIAIAADHAGFKLKEDLKKFLVKRGFEVLDQGTDSDKSVDYPDTTGKAASLVSQGKVRRGVTVCGTGIGSAITANKFPGVRAALVYEPETARLSREHNDANMIVFGGRFTPPSKARKILSVWLSTPFSGEERHKRRINKIRSLEKKLLALGLVLLFSLPFFLVAATFTWEGKDLSLLTLKNCSYRLDAGRVIYRTNEGLITKSMTNDSRIIVDYDQPSASGPETELYLDFNSENPRTDLTGNYPVKKYDVYKNRSVTFRDTPAAGFDLADNGVILATKRDSLFNQLTDMESFTISFWLKTSYSSGRRMILEKGNFIRNKFHGLRIFLQSGKLVFRFENMWFDPKAKVFTLELQGLSAVPPDSWNNYCASYDNTTGKLVLFVNNREDDLVWATVDREPESALLVPHFSGLSDLVIGGQPFGEMDDLFVSRSFASEPPHSTVHSVPQAEVLTGILENPFFNTEILSASLNHRPSLKGCSVLIRTSDKDFSAGDIKPDWSVFDAPLKAKYFQVKVILDAGEDRGSSPVLKSLGVATKDAMGVEPPSFVTLSATNDQLKVAWDKLFDRRIRGYFVTVKDPAAGTWQRIDAGDASVLLVPGLKDRQEYSVTITSYDDSVPFNESRPSREQKIFFTFRSSPHE